MEGGRLEAFARGGKGRGTAAGLLILRVSVFFSFSLGNFWGGGSFLDFSEVFLSESSCSVDSFCVGGVL